MHTPTTRTCCMFSQMVMTQTKWPTFSSLQKSWGKNHAAPSSCRTVHKLEQLPFTVRSGVSFLSRLKTCESVLHMCKKKNGAISSYFWITACTPPAFKHPCVAQCTSLTQHSRPRTLDRRFSPILVEVLKKKEREKHDERVRQWKRGKLEAVKLLEAIYGAISAKASGDLLPPHCVSLSLSLQG